MAKQSGVLLCYAAVLALAAATSALDLIQTPEEKTLMEWAISEGTVTKASISRNKDGVRGLFATEPIKTGDVILHVPEHLVLSVKNVGAAEAAPTLLKEIHTPCSRLKAYMDVLPKEDEVLTGYNWPDEYVPYLASQYMESQIQQSFQRHVKDVLDGKHNNDMEMTLPEAVGRMNVTYVYFKFITAMLTTRTFSIRKAALSMVPVADMANHDVREINKLDDGTEPGFRIIAGKDHAVGEEVTITYGPMRNDELLLYYGFLDEVTQPPRLAAIDHPKYELYKTDSDTLGDEAFTGTADEIKTEIVRLQTIETYVKARVEELGPVPNTVPYIKQVTERFTELRLAALAHEIGRLQGLLSQTAEL